MAMEAVDMKKFRCFYVALIFGFLLGVKDGYISLWTDSSNDPIEVFPYQARFLPSADQQALERGIPIENEEELNRLLEDYLS